MMNFLPIEETKIGTNYELIDNLSKSDVQKHASQDWFISYRRGMGLFRAGSLPLVIETGRYANPPVPVENRLCVVCNKNCAETENHFLLDCPLYDDLRLILFLQCSVY